jgi:SAM-dependent methyltransferase
MEMAQELTRSVCPLSGAEGVCVATRSREDLVWSYERFFGLKLSNEIQDKYFPSIVNRWWSPSSGLEWYSPTRMGASDFYEVLGTLPWYYSPETWDKACIFNILSNGSCRSVLEIGCGPGKFLQRLVAAGVECVGVDFNESAIAEGRNTGLHIYHPDDPLWHSTTPDTLVLLQCLEHVEHPVAFLQQCLALQSVRQIVLSVPCREGLLGRSSDPLNWPPHHATFWNLEAFQTLAKVLGMRIASWDYEPGSWQRFDHIVSIHSGRQLHGLPKWPRGKTGHALFELAKALRVGWARYGHSMVVALQRAA